MGNNNTRRIETSEGGSTFVGDNQEVINREIDARISNTNFYLTITRDVDNLVQKTEYFRDLARTNLAIKREFTRVTGLGSLKLISTITTTFYEEDGTTVDSTVAYTSTRSSNATLNRILYNDNPFSTTEDQDI